MKDAFFLKHLLFADAGALSLNQGEKILCSHDFFQLSRQQKARKCCCLMKQFYLLMIQQIHLMSKPHSQGFFCYSFQNHTFVKEAVKHFCETILCVCAEVWTF